jgi:hemoglobin
MMTEPLQNPYDQIGRESALRRLVDRFYDIMDSDRAAQPIRRLHPKSLHGSREKLFLFLSGWPGGPPLYQQRYGHPMLRRRHLPFSIGRAERDRWLACMNRALDELDLSEPLRQHLSQGFFQLADHLRNRPEERGETRSEVVPGPSP